MWFERSPAPHRSPCFPCSSPKRFVGRLPRTIMGRELGAVQCAPTKGPSLQPERAGCLYAVQRGRDRSEPIRAVGPILVGACELRAIARDEVPPHGDLLGERPAAQKEYPGSL